MNGILAVALRKRDVGYAASSSRVAVAYSVCTRLWVGWFYAIVTVSNVFVFPAKPIRTFSTLCTVSKLLGSTSTSDNSIQLRRITLVYIYCNYKWVRSRHDLICVLIFLFRLNLSTFRHFYFNSIYPHTVLQKRRCECVTATVEGCSFIWSSWVENFWQFSTSNEWNDSKMEQKINTLRKTNEEGLRMRSRSTIYLRRFEREFFRFLYIIISFHNDLRFLNTSTYSRFVLNGSFS
jgi:hypothetical protein